MRKYFKIDNNNCNGSNTLTGMNETTCSAERDTELIEGY